MTRRYGGPDPDLEEPDVFNALIAAFFERLDFGEAVEGNPTVT